MSTLLTFKEFTEMNESIIRRIAKRVRKGKVQLQKKVVDKLGYKMVNGKAVKMSAVEKRNRKISQRSGVRKRKAKQAKTNVTIKRVNRRFAPLFKAIRQALTRKKH